MDAYARLEKIGEGTYGIVTKARHIPTNRIVALKRFGLKMLMKEFLLPL